MYLVDTFIICIAFIYNMSLRYVLYAFIISYLLYVSLCIYYTYLFYAFTPYMYSMHLFHTLILCISAPDGAGSPEKFQESSTEMKGAFGEEKNPSVLFAFHVFIPDSLH